MNNSRVALITLLFSCFFIDNYAQDKTSVANSQKLRLVLEIDTLTQQLYGLAFFEISPDLPHDSLYFATDGHRIEQVSLGKTSLSVIGAHRDSSYFLIVLDSLSRHKLSDSSYIQVRYRLAWANKKLDSKGNGKKLLFPIPQKLPNHFVWEMYLTLPEKFVSTTGGEFIYMRYNADGTHTDYWQGKQAEGHQAIWFKLKARH